jgi:hypothetical protein
LYKFLFTRDPLWKIWNVNQPATGSVPPGSVNSAQPDSLNLAAEDDRV